MIEYRGGCKREKKCVYVQTCTVSCTFKSCVGESVCIVGTDSIMYVPQREKEIFIYNFFFIQFSTNYCEESTTTMPLFINNRPISERGERETTPGSRKMYSCINL